MKKKRRILIAYHSCKIMLEIVERYVVLCVLVFTSPLAWATLCSSSTRPIFKKWMSMVISACLLLLLGAWCMMMMFSVLETIGSSPVLQTLIFVAFSKVAQKMDNMLQTLGLSPAITGASLLDDIVGLGIWSTASRFAGNAMKGASKTMAARSSASSGRSAASGPQSANGNQQQNALPSGQNAQADANRPNDPKAADPNAQQQNALAAGTQQEKDPFAPDDKEGTALTAQPDQKDIGKDGDLGENPDGIPMDGEHTNQLNNELNPENEDQQNAALASDEHAAMGADQQNVQLGSEQPGMGGADLAEQQPAIQSDDNMHGIAAENGMDHEVRGNAEFAASVGEGVQAPTGASHGEYGSAPNEHVSAEGGSANAARYDAAPAEAAAAPAGGHAPDNAPGQSYSSHDASAPVSGSGGSGSDHTPTYSGHESSDHTPHDTSYGDSYGSGSRGEPASNRDTPSAETVHTSEKTYERFEVVNDHSSTARNDEPVKVDKVDVHVDRDDYSPATQVRPEEPYKTPTGTPKKPGSVPEDGDFGAYSAPMQNKDE